MKNSPMQLDRVELKTEIPIRRPTFELTPSMPRHWHGDGPFATHFLNALSSTFPFGEVFFVRSVLHYRKSIDDPALLAQIRGFAGQEGQHSRMHDIHVELLIAQGYSAIATRNRFGDLATRRQNRNFPKISLAMTSGLEHLQVSRSQLLRIATMAGTTLGLMIGVIDRLAYMFWKDGLLFNGEMWSEGRRFLFGRDGFLCGLGRDYRAWFRKDFHPDDLDDRSLIEATASVINADLATSHPA